MSGLASHGKLGSELLVLAALLAAACAVLYGLARVQGPTRNITEPVPFNERGTFEYGGNLGTAVYDGNTLKAPQPLFRRLDEHLPLTYRYQLRAGDSRYALADARGSYTLTAELRQANGWMRSMSLVPRTAFTGDSFSAKGVLDVAAMAEMIRALEQETGYKAPVFRVRVVADVEARGQLAARPVTRTLHQTIDFQLSELELRLDPEASTVDVSSGGDVSREVAVPRYLSVPMTSVRIEYARLPLLAQYGLGVSAVIAIIVWGATFITKHRVRPHARIAARYASIIIDVDRVPHPEGAVQVDDLERLMKLAERFATPVLHTRAPGERFYAVIDAVPMYFEVVAFLGWSRMRTEVDLDFAASSQAHEEAA